MYNLTKEEKTILKSLSLNDVRAIGDEKYLCFISSLISKNLVKPVYNANNLYHGAIGYLLTIEGKAEVDRINSERIIFILSVILVPLVLFFLDKIF